jgi:hypothetical protein
MPLCDFDNDAKTCPACGYKAKRLPTYRECRPVPEKQWQPIAIGDLVERVLTAVGVTKERVERLTRTEGKPGGCGCGCDGRKKWLNEVGYKAQYAIRDGYKAVERFYLGGN